MFIKYLHYVEYILLKRNPADVYVPAQYRNLKLPQILNFIFYFSDEAQSGMYLSNFAYIQKHQLLSLKKYFKTTLFKTT